MKYSKGDWKVIKDDFRRIYIDTPTRSVASIQRQSTEDEANARLIAAAPDMYEALKELIDHMTLPQNDIHRPYLADVKRLAIKALAKAEGKETK